MRPACRRIRTGSVRYRWHDSEPWTRGGTTERVLRLLGLLQQRPVWTGPELAERLGVTTRSIRRDVERLRVARLPGQRHPGRRRRLPARARAGRCRRCCSTTRRRSPPRSRCGSRPAARWPGPARPRVRTLAKLDQVLPARLRAEVRALHDAIVTLEGGRIEVDADALLRAGAGLPRHGAGRVRLRGARRRAGPSAGSSRTSSWPPAAGGTCMAFDLDRDDWRTFRLDRMSEVRADDVAVPAARAPGPGGVRPAGGDRARRTATRPGCWCTRRPRRCAERDQRRGRHRRAASTTRPACSSPASDSLYGLALPPGCLGWDFEVLEPPELREALAELGGGPRAAGALPDAVG